MPAIQVNTDLVAHCGLYCGACKSYLNGKCKGCHENSKAAWCKIRSCCIRIVGCVLRTLRNAHVILNATWNYNKRKISPSIESDITENFPLIAPLSFHVSCVCFCLLYCVFNLIVFVNRIYCYVRMFRYENTKYFICKWLAYFINSLEI